MKATLNKTFSDADIDARCENCDDQLRGATQLWTIDEDESYGWFCSKDCANQYIMFQNEK